MQQPMIPQPKLRNRLVPRSDAARPPLYVRPRILSPASPVQSLLSQTTPPASPESPSTRRRLRIVKRIDVLGLEDDDDDDKVELYSRGRNDHTRRVTFGEVSIVGAPLLPSRILSTTWHK